MFDFRNRVSMLSITEQKDLSMFRWQIIVLLCLIVLSGCTGATTYYFTGLVKEFNSENPLSGVTISGTNFDIHRENGGSISKYYNKGVVSTAEGSFTVSSFLIYDCPIGCSKCSPPTDQLNFGFYFTKEGYLSNERIYSGGSIKDLKKDVSGAIILPDTFLARITQ